MCDILMEGGVRRLTLKSCQVEQAGEVSYQALNAITSSMLNVKGKKGFGHVNLTNKSTRSGK